MNRRFFIAWVVIFVAWLAGSYVVHGVLLHADYEKVKSLFRPEVEAQQYFPFMILGHVVMAAAFVWIYSRGIEAKPWAAQGIRFGIAVAARGASDVPHLLRGAAHAGRAGREADGIDAILVLILGTIVAFLCRTAARPS
jgi:hypothetical protein